MFRVAVTSEGKFGETFVNVTVKARKYLRI